MKRNKMKKGKYDLIEKKNQKYLKKQKELRIIIINR
jgi:hypothetical protein